MASSDLLWSFLWEKNTLPGSFQLGDKIFRQVIGIPMASDPASFFSLLLWEQADIETKKTERRA